jgi:hypothetical protein
MVKNDIGRVYWNLGCGSISSITDPDPAFPNSLGSGFRGSECHVLKLSNVNDMYNF